MAVNKHSERLRNDPSNIVEMLINLLDPAESLGCQVVAKIRLPGSVTLIVGAEPEDFQPDDGDL